MSVMKTPTSVCLAPATITQAASYVCANQALFSQKVDGGVMVNRSDLNKCGQHDSVL